MALFQKSIIEKISDDIKNNISSCMYLNLPFFEKVKIGDFGYFDEGTFSKKGNLSNLNIDCKSESTAILKDFISQKGQTVQFKFETSPVMDIELEKGSSYYLRGDIESKESLENIFEVQNNLRGILKKDKAKNDDNKVWNKKYKIITALYTSSKTILIANKTGKSKISTSLNCSSLVALTPANIFLPEVKVTFSINKSSEEAIYVLPRTAEQQDVFILQFSELTSSGEMRERAFFESAPPVESDYIGSNDDENDYNLKIAEINL